MFNIPVAVKLYGITRTSDITQWTPSPSFWCSKVWDEILRCECVCMYASAVGTKTWFPSGVFLIPMSSRDPLVSACLCPPQHWIRGDIACIWEGGSEHWVCTVGTSQISPTPRISTLNNSQVMLILMCKHCVSLLGCSLDTLQTCFRFALSWVSTRILSKVASTTHNQRNSHIDTLCYFFLQYNLCLCKRQPTGPTGDFKGDTAPGMGLQSCLVEAQTFTSFLSYSALICFISSICNWMSVELFSISLTLKNKRTEMLLYTCHNQFNSWITVFKIKQARLLLYLANCN